jgi:hypothetical protein
LKGRRFQTVPTPPPPAPTVTIDVPANDCDDLPFTECPVPSATVSGTVSSGDVAMEYQIDAGVPVSFSKTTDTTWQVQLTGDDCPELTCYMLTVYARDGSGINYAHRTFRRSE